jgi:peptidoglycan/xylan/chitin deacetylase (PgdA/CDA1 family)
MKFNLYWKYFLYPFLRIIGVDAAFRYLNRQKIVILVYHGITSNNFFHPPWTLLPVSLFEKHIRFLKQHYKILPLGDVVSALNQKKVLPTNTAVVTFDDGYRNNFTNAFPILSKYGIPATIFLTAGYIGTRRLLPLDKAYLLCRDAQIDYFQSRANNKHEPLSFRNDKERMLSYNRMAEILKKLSTSDQELYLKMFQEGLGVTKFHTKNAINEDFRIVSWDEVITMRNSGWIEIGSHTVSHEILTNVPDKIAEKEIANSKSILEEYLNEPITLFAYPNGQESDFSENHIKILCRTGFSCSVTTIPALNFSNENIYRLKRMSFGSDFSGNLDYFALRTSGCLSYLKGIVKNVYI